MPRNHQLRLTAFTLLTSLALILTACHAPQPAEQRKRLSYDAVFGPDRVNFTGHYPRNLNWLPDGRHYTQRRGAILQRINAQTGAATPAYDHAQLEATLKAHPAFPTHIATHLARHPTLTTDNYDAAILEHDDQLYYYTFANNQLQQVADANPDRELVTLSPDTTHLAYHHAGDLYTINLATHTTTRLTRDGSKTLLNGKLDWVYQEEIFGRGRWRSYWWSPDGQTIAFLQLDQSQVPQHTIVDLLPTHTETRTFHYPKAGDPNPIPRIGFIPAAGGDITWADLSRYNPRDLLVYPPNWSPAGDLAITFQNREGTWLDLALINPQSGTTNVLLRETSPAFVHNLGQPHWLPDGSYLWRSAHDGWPHIYHKMPDHFSRRLTRGQWEVRELFGVDDDGWVYFTGTRDSHVAENAYRVPLAGGNIERLTHPDFYHTVNFDPHCRYFIDRYSNANTPPKVNLKHASGQHLRTLSHNSPTTLGEYDLPHAEILRFTADNGHTLNAMLFRPPNLDPRKKYPVVHFVYGGPHMPAVSNHWAHGGRMFERLLAEMGYLVWILDPWSASGEGQVSAWHCWQRLGVAELEDLEAGLRWLATHEPADLDRVAIFGHSYGGFIVAHALTHSNMFKLGLAAAALTDWRNYDSVYAERYMRTPENNPTGYDDASAISAAENLHGWLVIAHGVQDDNVHVQNALQLADALQHAGHHFTLMLYPRCRHGLYRNNGHWDALRIKAIKERL